MKNKPQLQRLHKLLSYACVIGGYTGVVGTAIALILVAVTTKDQIPFLHYMVGSDYAGILGGMLVALLIAEAPRLLNYVLLGKPTYIPVYESSN